MCKDSLLYGKHVQIRHFNMNFPLPFFFFCRFFLDVSIIIPIFATSNQLTMAKKKGIRIDSNTRRDLFDKFADYALDLSKLVFGGVILAGIMGMSVNTNLLFGLGATSVVILSLLAFVLIVLKHNNRR